jgi:hypothetical protein
MAIKRYKKNLYSMVQYNAEITLYLVCDTEAELPTQNNTPGNLAFTKDTNKLWKWGTSWVEVEGGGGGNGYCIQGSAANQSTTTDNQTLYWGNTQLAPTTTAGNTRIYIPKAGTIKAAYVFAHSATAGSVGNWSMYIRKNNTVDTLIETLSTSSALRVWSNTALSITVALGDYVEIKEIQPAWATNPANVRRSFIIYIE